MSFFDFCDGSQVFVAAQNLNLAFAANTITVARRRNWNLLSEQFLHERPICWNLQNPMEFTNFYEGHSFILR
jgi:hypothetical protein